MSSVPPNSAPSAPPTAPVGPVPVLIQALTQQFAASDPGQTRDGTWYVHLPVHKIVEAVEVLRGRGFDRFLDLTAVDDPEREDRFELNYLFHSLTDRAWFRLKTRTIIAAPSITPSCPGANWYEREIYDLFGVRFDGHPNLRRLMLPDDWQGHPLRRDHPIGAEPIDFVVTREVYGT